MWIALADSGAFLSVNHIPPLPIPHGLEYALGSGCTLVSSIHGWRPGGDPFHVPPGPAHA